MKSEIIQIPLERTDDESMKLAWAMYWAVLILSDMADYAELIEKMRHIYIEGITSLNAGCIPSRVEIRFISRMAQEIYKDAISDRYYTPLY